MFSTRCLLRVIIWLCVWLVLPIPVLLAQNQVYVGVKLVAGSVWVHTPKVRAASPSDPVGFKMELLREWTDSVFQNQYGCKSFTGYSLQYTDFRMPILGHAVAASYFFQPRIIEAGNFHLDYRASIGACWLSNPYSAESNPLNQSYSTPINPYLVLGVHAFYRIHNRMLASVSLNSHHVSSGGLYKPNNGINWFSGSAGFYYKLNKELPQYRVRRTHIHPIGFEAGLWLSHPQLEVASSKRFYVFGTSLLAVRRGKLHTWSVGGEACIDNLYANQATILKGEAQNPLIFSGLIGHSFLLGRFDFKQHIGVYFSDVGVFYPAWYHRWGLTYFVTPSMGLGASLKATKQNANFIDVHVIYRKM